MKKACFVAKHGDESLHIFKCYRLRTESGPKISSVCVKVFEEMVTFFLSLSLSLYFCREKGVGRARVISRRNWKKFEDAFKWD